MHIVAGELLATREHTEPGQEQSSQTTIHDPLDVVNGYTVPFGPIPQNQFCMYRLGSLPLRIVT